MGTGALHIAIDAQRLRDFGVGTHIRNLLGSMKQVDSTNRYTIICGPGDAELLEPLPQNFTVVEHKPVRGGWIADVRYGLFLRSLGADVYHMPSPGMPYWMPRPYLVTVHDLSSMLFPDHRNVRRSYDDYRLRRELVEASRIIAVSGATSRDLQNLVSIPKPRIRVIYNAPDPMFSQSSVSEDQHQRRLLEERYQITYPYLLYAGTIRARKNVSRLVEAFAVLRTDLATHPVYKNLRLVIIGDEVSKYPQLRRTVIQSKTENLVRFLGFVPIETLRAFYKSAAAFVFPSLYEGFGLPPLEAMACGTAVVTSDLSSLPEVVGDAAMIVNPENVFDIARGIRQVLLDEALRRRCVRLGLEHLRRFSWRKTAAEVVETYLEVGRSHR